MRPDGETLVGRVPRESWKMVVLLALIYVTVSIDRTVISLVSEPLKHAYHLTDAQVGLLAGVAFTVPFGLAVLSNHTVRDAASNARARGSNEPAVCSPPAERWRPRSPPSC